MISWGVLIEDFLQGQEERAKSGLSDPGGPCGQDNQPRCFAFRKCMVCCLNHQIIKKSWNVTPVMEDERTDGGKWKIEQCSELNQKPQKEQNDKRTKR